MSIAENIKRLREQHGLTQEEFGEIAGVSAKAVSKWESGQADPRMGAVQKLADHFHISKSVIIDDYVEDERQRALEKAFSYYPDMRILFDAANDLDPEDVERFAKMIIAFKGE